MTTFVRLQKTRNFGVIAHIDAGKTTTSERILFYTKKIHRMGDVHDGTTSLDYMKQEKDRGITITAAATTCFWREHRLQLIDTPGHMDFTMEVERSLRVLDGAVVVFSAVEGVEPQSETVWRQATRHGVPRICFVNKIDRVGADYFAVVAQIEKRLGVRALVLQIPFDQGPDFKGIVDLVTEKLVVWEANTDGKVFREEAVPAALLPLAREWRNRLIETVADEDDAILARWLEGGAVSAEELRALIRKATLTKRVFPVLVGSAYHYQGVQPLLDAIVDYLPSPLDVPPVKGVNGEERGVDSPFAAIAFKLLLEKHTGMHTFLRVYSGSIEAGSTVWNATRGKRERIGRILEVHGKHGEERTTASAGDIVSVVGLKETRTGDTLSDERAPITLEPIRIPTRVIELSIEARSSEDAEKLGLALRRLAWEDPSLSVRVDDETGQTLLSGMGELHLDVIVKRLLDEDEFGLAVKVGEPQVAYRETVAGVGEAEGKYIRQSGGSGHYGHVVLRVEPAPKGQGFVFEDATSGGKIPRQFVSSIQKGIEGALGEGVLAGYPIVDVKATLLDGSFHQKDSNDMAFQIAASIGFKEACRRASPTLLEPVMAVTVTTPAESLGDVLGDLASRRGKIRSTSERAGDRIVDASVPLAEMFGYSGDLRGKTSGRASYVMELGAYEPAPPQVRAAVVARQ